MTLHPHLSRRLLVAVSLLAAAAAPVSQAQNKNKDKSAGSPEAVAAAAAASAATAANAAASAAASAALNAPGAPTLIPASLFTVPEGFEVTLWARTPLFRNPTNMDVDAQGRIWVTEGANYRKHAGRDPEGDRVVVLEDTDGNGSADKSSVFVQEPTWSAPLGMAVIDNQIIVSHAPDLIVFTDVDRDGKFDPRIDKRDVLLTGFNGRNHDHSLHSVTFGPDGLWYFNQGNCGALVTDRSGQTFRVGSPYDPVKSGGAIPTYSWKPSDFAGAKSDDGHVYTGGFAMRMQPNGTHLEVIGFGFRNSYEQTVTSYGDVFQNDNDDPPACRTTFLMEYGNVGFFSKDGQRNWNADRRPGQTTPTAEWRQDDPGSIPAGDVYGGGAPTGIAFYEGDAFGEKWRGLLLSCESARNTIFGYLPQAEGAGYRLDRFHFITTNQEERFEGVDFKGGARSIVSHELKSYFRPADVVVGPDGAIYFADWFDPRVGGHQDLDDKMSGAIYRIAPKGFKSVVPKLDVSTTAGQIAALKSPAVNPRALGFNGLRAQGAAAVAPVAALLNDANPYIRARAVYLLAQLGSAGLAKVETQLRAADPMIRIAAFRALRRVKHRVLENAPALATDPSAAVRREVALALRDVPFAQARELLLTLARGYDGRDRSYLEAWGIGCSGKEADVYRALKATEPDKNPEEWSPAYANLVWRLTPAEAVPAFAKRAQSSKLGEKDRVAAVTALGFIPTREAASAILDVAEKSSGQTKSHAFWWALNYKDSRWKEFNLAGALKERGIYDPAKVTIAESLVPAVPTGTVSSAATVAALKGDPQRGAISAQACLLCHRIGDQGIDYAPDLTGFASRQTTEVVIGAILNPSLDISHGFDGTEVVTSNGTKVHGIVQSSGDPLIVQSTGGLTQMIPAGQVKVRKPLGRSLMLSAAQMGLKDQDVADITAYLKTR